MDNKETYPNLNTPNAIKNRFSGERAVECGKKGNKARSDNIKVKKTLINLLQDKVRSNIGIEIFKQSGMDTRTAGKQKNKDAIVQAMLLQALSGNYKYTELILKIIGEMPADNTAFNSENQKQDLQMIVEAIGGVKYAEESTEADEEDGGNN